MGMTMEYEIKRWTAKRKAVLVVEIVEGKTSISEASGAFDIAPSEIEEWVDEAKRSMGNALRAKPLDIKDQYEWQLKELQEAYGEAMLELRARKSFNPCWAPRTRNDPGYPTGFAIRRCRGFCEPTVSLV
jgi:transposase-like protein